MIGGIGSEALQTLGAVQKSIPQLASWESILVGECHGSGAADLYQWSTEQHLVRMRKSFGLKLFQPPSLPDLFRQSTSSYRWITGTSPVMTDGRDLLIGGKNWKYDSIGEGDDLKDDWRNWE